MFRRAVTVQYPHVEIPVPPRYRGPVRLVIDEETGDHRCIACLSCQKVCPALAIPVLTPYKDENNKSRPAEFVIDDALCCFCGLCVDQCPKDALEHSPIGDLSVSDRGSLRRTIIRDKKLTEDNNPVEKHHKRKKK